jgi:hypothetical protein
MMIDVVFDMDHHNSIYAIAIENELKLLDVKTDPELN